MTDTSKNMECPSTPRLRSLRQAQCRRGRRLVLFSMLRVAPFDKLPSTQLGTGRAGGTTRRSPWLSPFEIWPATSKSAECPSTRSPCLSLSRLLPSTKLGTSRDNSTQPVALVFRNMACHEQIKNSPIRWMSFLCVEWWRRWDLNPRPPACEAGALPLSYVPTRIFYREKTYSKITGLARTQPWGTVLKYQILMILRAIFDI